MSLISLSTNQITFQTNDPFKTVQMINLGTTQLNPKPIMYKIKTNKIDYVDAKPSCGYISGLKGQNQINVVIRSLTSNKQFSAKLQILYVSDDRITQELVQKNKKHFDLIQYNELYDSIKKGNQSDVKTAIINVTRKGVDPAQQAPIDPHSDSKSKLKIAELSQSIKEKTMNKLDTIPTKQKKSSLKSSLIFLIIGILIGYLLGANYGTKFNLFNHNSHSLQTLENVKEDSQQYVAQDEQTDESKFEGQTKVYDENEGSQEQTTEPQQVQSQNDQQLNNKQTNSQVNEEPQETIEKDNEIKEKEKDEQQLVQQLESELMDDQELQQQTIVLNVDEDTL